MDDFMLALLIWGVVIFVLKIRKTNGATFLSIPFSLAVITLYTIVCMELTTTSLYTNVEVDRQNLAYDKNFETYCYTIVNKDTTTKNDKFMVMYENGETKSIPKNGTTIVKDDQNVVIVYDKTPSNKFLKAILFDVQNLQTEIHVKEVKTVIF